eukprot:XP_022277061.1 aquaporin-10 isoform X6 [Canis lupus familiaris]
MCFSPFPVDSCSFNNPGCSSGFARCSVPLWLPGLPVPGAPCSWFSFLIFPLLPDPHSGCCGTSCHQWRRQRQLLHHVPGCLPSCYDSHLRAHLNPAFSLAMCLLGRLPWAKLPIYCLVQLLSAFCASGATYALYYDALQNYTGGNLTVMGPKETASIFATYPAPYLSLNNGFLDQVLGTGILIVGILAILDTRNKGVPAGLEPVAVGLLILAIGLSMGANCGFPLNPARDLGPRLFTYVAGWGPEVFSAGNGWWWVPVVAPLVGATLGTATYQLLVALHHSEESEPAQDLEFAQHKASDLEIPASAQCKL